MSQDKKQSSTAVDDDDEKLDFKTILPIFVIVLVDLLGLTIIIPLLPIYAASFGANAFVIGLLGASYPLMQFIGAPILGRLSDRFGRRPVLIVSQIGTFAGFILLGFANSLALLFISRLIDGISGANIATAQAVIADRTTEKTRTQGLGLIGAAFGLGFIVGPLIAFAILALSAGNYQLVAFTAAVFSFISIVLTVFWLEESLPEEQRGKVGHKKVSVGPAAMLQALRTPLVGLLLILMFAQQFAFGGFEQLLSLFTLNRLGMNASSNAALFVYVGVIIVAVQGYFIGKWSRRFGERLLILSGLLLLGVALTLTAVTPSVTLPWYSEANLITELSQQSTEANIQIDLPAENNGWLGLFWILVALFPASIGGGILQPSINSMLTKLVAMDEVGGILGVSTGFYSLATALSPVILGAIFEQFGSTAPFLIGGLLLLVLWFLTWRMLPVGIDHKGGASPPVPHH